MKAWTDISEDSFLDTVISSKLGNEKYTVIYITTPQGEEQSALQYQAQQIYEMDDPFPTAMHTELRRDIESHAKDVKSEGGLFERYQFLSPGTSFYDLQLSNRPNHFMPIELIKLTHIGFI